MTPHRRPSPRPTSPDDTTQAKTADGRTRTATADHTAPPETAEAETRAGTVDGRTRTATADGAAQAENVDDATRSETAEAGTRAGAVDGTTRTETAEGTAQAATAEGWARAGTVEVGAAGANGGAEASAGTRVAVGAEPAAAPTTAAPTMGGAVRQFGLLAGPLLTMLDSSIANVAIAPIAHDLGAGLDAVQWAISGYLLMLGAGLAITSFLARRFGTLPVYRTSMVLFTLASAGCAAAPNIELLIGARMVQGLVGAPLVPLAMSLLFGGDKAARTASPIAGMLLFLAPALGPSLGGALIAAGGWRWVFLVNLPVGVLAALAATRIPASAAPGPQPTERLDVPGLILLACGLTSVLYGAGRGGTAGWSAPGTVWPLVGGAVLLGGYLVWANRRRKPVLDLELLRHRASGVAVLLCAMASVITFTAVFLVPVFTQSVQHHGSLATGLALLPQGVVTGLGTVAGRQLLGKLPVRVVVLGGFTVLAATSAGLLAITATTPLPLTAVILSGRAASVGLVITPLLFRTTAGLTDAQLADANSLFNICQRLAGSLGIALLASLFTAWSTRFGAVSGLHRVSLLLTGIAVLAVPIALLLPAKDPELSAG